MENDKMFNFIEKIYSELQSTRAEMQQGFKGVNLRLEALDAGQITLETRLEDTRKTLFDGYMQNSEKIALMDEKLTLMDEKLTLMDDKLDNLKIEVNSISMKTTYNDTRIIEISKDLKNAK